MDLILIGNGERSAAVHGLNWTQHCTIDANELDNNNNNNNADDIVSVAWHPSGRRCLAARRDGMVDVVFVDQQKSYSVRVLYKAGESGEQLVAISAVHQVNCEPACIYIDRTAQHFPITKRLHKTIEHLVDASFAAPVPHVSNYKLLRLYDGSPTVAPRVILYCALTSAHRVLLTIGRSMLRIAAVDVVGELREDGGAPLVVRQCSVAPDLSSIVSVVQRGDTLHLSCRHGSRLWAHRGELAMLGAHRTGLWVALQEITEQVNTMRTQWRTARQPFQQKLDALAGMLRDAGSSTTVELEFEGLVTTGRPSPTMHQFMSQQTGEQTMRRFHASLKQALVAIQHRISSFLTLLLDEMMFRVDEMRSCAHWTERFAPLGVNADTSFERVAKAAEHVALALSNVSTGVALISQRYEAFWQFFIERVTALRVNTDGEPSTGAVGDDLVLAFIKFDVLHDNVASLLEAKTVSPDLLAPVAAPISPDTDTSAAAAIRSWQEFVRRMPTLGAPLTLDGAIDNLTSAFHAFLSDEFNESDAARFDEWGAVPLCSARAATQPYSLAFVAREGHSFAYVNAVQQRLVADEAVASAMPALLADIEHANEVSCTMAVACVVEAASGDNRTIVLMHLPSPLDCALGSDGEVCAFQFQSRRITSLSYSRTSKSVVVLHEGGSGGSGGQLSMFDVSELEFQPFEVTTSNGESLAESVLTSGVLEVDAVPFLAPSEARHLERGKAKLTALHVNHDRSLAAVQIGKRKLMLFILDGGGGDDDQEADADEGVDETNEAE